MATKATPRKRTATPAAKKKAPKKAKAADKPAGAGKKKATPRPTPAATKKKAVSKKASGATAKTPRKRSRPRPVRARAVDKKYRPFGALLMKKQAELMQAYAVAKTDTRDRLDDGTEDYIDYAVNSYAKDFMLSLTELERQQLQLVREALHRLNRGEYGSCLQCGVEIPMKRLEVSPWVRYCIQCQELEDQGLLPQQSFAQFDDDDGAFADDSDDEVEIEEEDAEDETDDDEEAAPVSATADDDEEAAPLEIDDSEE